MSRNNLLQMECSSVKRRKKKTRSGKQRGCSACSQCFPKEVPHQLALLVPSALPPLPVQRRLALELHWDEFRSQPPAGSSSRQPGRGSQPAATANHLWLVSLEHARASVSHQQFSELDATSALESRCLQRGPVTDVPSAPSETKKSCCFPSETPAFL